MHKKYAKALFELLTQSKDAQEQDKVLDAFFVLLKKQNKEKMLHKIFFELQRLSAKLDKTAPKVKIASDKFRQAALEKAKTMGLDETSVTEDPSLIGGFRIDTGSEVYDASYKRYLLDLYNKLSS